MCTCYVCRDSARFQQELAKLPFDVKPVFEQLHEELTQAEADTAYYRAILDGNWPNADSILQRFHRGPVQKARFAQAPRARPELDRVVNALAQDAKPYFTQLVTRVVQAGLTRAKLYNLVHNTTEDASGALTQYRAQPA